MENITKKIVVHGIVQGVGYRSFAQRTAISTAVKGWVKNRHDGAVELMVTGNSIAIDTFVNKLYVGPMGSSVERIEVIESNSQDYFGFEIRF